jgi:AsmA-like C-terminal region/Protein of unknown function
MNERIAGTLAKLTTEGGKAILTLSGRGRALVKRVPPTVQIELAKLSSRSAHVCREIFAGVLVVGLIAIVFGYGRLARGPISLPGLVPPIETAINDQLSGLHVKIDDAILQRSSDGPGVLFRLRNIRLIDKDGSIVAQAPLAAIGMSGAALLAGRLAPGSVDFIGSRLLLFHTPDQGLSLSFSRPSSLESEALIRGSLPAEGSSAPSTERVMPETTIAKHPEMPLGASGRKFDLTKTVAEVFDRARRGDTSYLTRFGFKDTIVVLNQSGTKTLWQVPDLAIDLEHRDRRSILIGQASVASSKGDWQLEVHTEQRKKHDSLAITALIENLVPSGIAGNFPSIGALKAFDMAVDGETTIELSKSGDFLSGEATLRLAPGLITPPWDPDTPMRIDHGDLKVRYLPKKDVVEIAPSTLRWGKSRATIRGTFRPVRDAKGTLVSWDFSLKASDAVFAVEEFGLGPTKINTWMAEGSIAPKDGRVTLSRFVIRAGKASIALSGSVVDAPGSPEIKLAGDVSPMSVDMLKQFWPKFLAGKAREWVLERISGGQVVGGKFNVALPAGALAKIEQGGAARDGAVNVELDTEGMSIAYIPKMPPLVAGRAKLTVSGTELSVDIPQAKIVVPSGREIALSEGRFFIPDLREDPQQGEITFRASGATPAVLQLLDHEPLGYIQAVGMKPDFLGGTAEGGFTLSMPLRTNLDFKQIKLRGMARLKDAIASNLVGNMNVDGGSLDVNLTEQGVEARGEVHIKGIPAELSWQRIFDAPSAQQPPITVSATLDEAMREKLGIKVNHLVQGPTPVTLSITGLGQPTQAMSMTADLTNARLLFGSMGWTKPPGQTANIGFDIAQSADGSTDLKNLKILGDDLAIYGDISLDPEQHLKGFHFSDFSIDSMSHVEITANVRDDQVLDISAEGPTYDGKQFFRSLFSAGQFAENGAGEPADPFGIDLTASIGTVVGFYDTTAKNVTVSLKKRDGRLVALDAKGELNGTTAAGVELVHSGRGRLLKAEASDAGAAFKLVGFYRSVEGGEASLQVDLDAGAPGTKSGTLWAQDFDVVGDSVVSDVLTDPSSAAVLGDTKKQVVRSRIAFRQLRAPFTVGAGKFWLKDAYMNGAQLGATLRGTVDFKSQMVDLGGTYIPLYGLNSAFRAIPIIGPVLGGRKGEGLVGITFAIKGKLDDPSVLVNPMSVMTPGIFRQIFDFTGSVPDATAASSSSSSSSFEDQPLQNR